MVSEFGKVETKKIFGGIGIFRERVMCAMIGSRMASQQNIEYHALWNRTPRAESSGVNTDTNAIRHILGFKTMKTLFLLVPLAVLCTVASPAQDKPAPRPGLVVDSLGLEMMFSKAEYPLLKGSGWSGAFPVEDPSEIPDPTREYKLLFEVIHSNPENTSGEINYSLDEIARILNLHVASGIPREHLKVVIAVHGPGIELATTDEAYTARHSVANPNRELIREMEEKTGAKFIVCGQAMAFFTTTRDELLPGMNVTYTTQTTLSDYQLRGYVRYTIIPDR